MLNPVIRYAMAFLCGISLLFAAASDHDCPAYPSSRWSFAATTLKQQASARERMLMLVNAFPTDFANIPARQNFIDDHIFDRLQSAGIPSAPLAGDAQFIRRVTIDLTGRIPDADRVRRFLQDQTTDKRTALIDELLASPAFVDRWTAWFDDLLKNTSSYSTVTVSGRNALHQYIHRSLEQGKPYSQLVTELLHGQDSSEGPANYILRTYSPGDPVQEFWDDLTANVTATFLGVQTLCISCHDGAHHLEPINTYLSRRLRSEFWQQSAFFSRMVVTQNDAYSLRDKSDGAYTTEIIGYQGQRPTRTGGPYDPRYLLTGEKASSDDYRAELSKLLTADFQFARTFVNRIWAHFMVVGIVDPPDAFDLDNYAAQASDPNLLDALAHDFIDNGYDIRQLMRRITSSSAYQLSSAYSGDWQEQYARLFARKLVRRMDAEEIHDSIVQATGVQESYAVDGFAQPVTWAMQLPDTNEPHDTSALLFMKSLGRGNRTYTPRDSTNSILGSLALANNAFVSSRIDAQTGVVLKTLLQQDTDDQLIEDLFVQTLSRLPKPGEIAVARRQSGHDRLRWAEDLQWALINRVEFALDY
jgi:hypothetical protein